MRKTLIFLFITLSISAWAQGLSDSAQISVLTVSPGDELYSKFGHSAIRVKDLQNNIDWVFNYGTFDFHTPHFYIKFIRGRLNYMLSVQSFRSFMYIYNKEERWVDEQVLNLTKQQKQRIFNFLMWNARRENRYYLYDFLFDNCATRVRDVVFDQMRDSIVFQNKQLNLTFRQAFNAYMKGNPWILFGENLLVGSVADKPMTAWEAMYLPDYLEQYFDSVRVVRNGNTIPIVKIKKRILDYHREIPRTPIYNPLVIFSLLALLVLFVSYKDLRTGRRRRGLDFTLFFILGLAGVVIAFLWFFSDHNAAKQNWNILWTMPLNFIYAFFLWKKSIPSWLKTFTKGLFAYYILVSVILAAGWLGLRIIPQQFDLAILPLLVMVLSRLYVLIKNT